MKKSISFYIVKKREDGRGFSPIYGQVTIKSKNYPFQVEKIKNRYWNKTKQRVNKNREHEPGNRHEEINKLLDRIAKNTERFDRFDNYSTPPPRDEVKTIFFQIVASSKTFNEAYDEFIEVNKKKVKPNTTRNRKTARNFIKQYEKHTGIEIQFSDIDLQFFENLYDYAMDIAEVENNTFAAYVAKFKTFQKWANKKEYYDGTNYKEFSFAEKEKTVVCLTKDEFDTLYSYDFQNERLNKTKDLFCFGCLTGLRFSDIASLRYEHFQGDYIVKNITKTTEDDRIPILPEAREIIDKYKNGTVYPLPRLSNVNLNKYIKECCQILKFDTSTIKNQYRRNEIIPTVYEKYKLITSHTARKTFISISIDKGMDPFFIKRITGHKKESTFDKYVKLTDNKIKDELDKAWGKDRNSLKIDFTAIIEKNNDGTYTGLVQEFPEATATGKTTDELTKNLLNSLQQVIEKRREQTASQFKDRKIITQKLNIFS